MELSNLRGDIEKIGTLCKALEDYEKNYKRQGNMFTNNFSYFFDSSIFEESLNVNDEISLVLKRNISDIISGRKYNIVNGSEDVLENDLSITFEYKYFQSLSEIERVTAIWLWSKTEEKLADPDDYSPLTKALKNFIQSYNQPNESVIQASKNTIEEFILNLRNKTKMARIESILLEFLIEVKVFWTNMSTQVSDKPINELFLNEYYSISYDILNSSYSDQQYDRCIKLGWYALACESPNNRIDTYITLASSASNIGNLQLAYDISNAWVSQKWLTPEGTFISTWMQHNCADCLPLSMQWESRLTEGERWPDTNKVKQLAKSKYWPCQLLKNEISSSEMIKAVLSLLRKLKSETVENKLEEAKKTEVWKNLENKTKLAILILTGRHLEIDNFKKQTEILTQIDIDTYNILDTWEKWKVSGKNLANDIENYRYSILSFKDLSEPYDIIYALTSLRENDLVGTICTLADLEIIEYDNEISIIKNHMEQSKNEQITTNDKEAADQSEQGDIKKYQNQVSTFYNNFAYYCSYMADNSGNATKAQKKLRILAVSYMEDAIALNYSDTDVYQNYAVTLDELYDDDRTISPFHSTVQKMLFIYQDLSHIKANKLYAYRELIFHSVTLGVLSMDNVEKAKEEVKFYVDPFIKLYNELNTQSKSYISNQGQEELLLGKDIFDIYNAIEKTKESPDKKVDLLYHILSISVIASRIKKVLCLGRIQGYELNDESFKQDIENNKPKAYAYYTTLKTFNYLLTDDKNEKNDNELNRFSIMEIRYMNDPQEGQMLYHYIENRLDKSKALFGSPETIVNTFLANHNVFAKCFTSLVDQLPMWYTYGSDTEEKGQNCNGCCVCVRPETFDWMEAASTCEGTKCISKDSEDHFQLFRVAYFVDTGESNGAFEIHVNNMKNNQISDYFDKLCNEHLEYLIDNYSTFDDLQYYIINALRKVMFLFKDSAYINENEVRILLFREADDRKDIITVSNNPAKLCIQPPYQVHIDKVIIGPKLPNKSDWLPYLQSELHKIGQKWPGTKDCEELNPIVMPSRIHIR